MVSPVDNDENLFCSFVKEQKLRMQDEKKNQQTDCLECRLVSGFGAIAIGVYIFSQAQKRRKFEANIMKLFSGGAVSLGIARLFNVPIFKEQRKNDS